MSVCLSKDGDLVLLILLATSLPSIGEPMILGYLFVWGLLHSKITSVSFLFVYIPTDFPRLYKMSFGLRYRTP